MSISFYIKDSEGCIMNISYNIGARYDIIGRVPNGTSIIGYVLRDKVTSEIGILSKDVVEQLALNKQIYNCTAQVYSGIVNLKGINCKLSQLPKYDQQGNLILNKAVQKKKIKADMKLVGKVQSGKTVKSYVVAYITNPNNVMKIPRDAVLKLVKDGRIANAKYQMNGDQVMLRGVKGENLSKLRVYSE